MAACNAKPTVTGKRQTWPRTSPGSTHPLAGEREQRLEEAMAHLPEREQQVLIAALPGGTYHAREAGDLMGVGESRVSQIHTLAVEHLRPTM